MNLFRLCVMTPQGTVCEREIRSAVLLTEDGEIGFLAGREECVIEVLAGDVRFREASGEEQTLETDGGIARMTGKDLTILCGAAYRKEDAEMMREARQKELSEERKRQEKSLAEYKLTRAALMRAFDKLKRSSQKR